MSGPWIAVASCDGRQHACAPSVPMMVCLASASIAASTATVLPAASFCLHRLRTEPARDWPDADGHVAAGSPRGVLHAALSGPALRRRPSMPRRAAAQQVEGASWSVLKHRHLLRLQFKPHTSRCPDRGRAAEHLSPGMHMPAAAQRVRHAGNHALHPDTATLSTCCVSLTFRFCCSGRFEDGI